MSERMRFEGKFGKEQPEKRALDPGPELQIVPQTPEVKRVPPGMAGMDIGEFLRKQKKEDERRKNNEKLGLDA